MPFIGGRLVAGAAKLGVRGYRHLCFWVTGLERAVARFTGHALMGIGAALGIKSGCMASQAGKV